MHTLLQYFRKNYVLALCEDAIQKKMFTLNLSRFDMKELPDIVEKCTLMRLFLNNNHLKELSPSIGKLEHLQVLTLDYNKLEGFPDIVCSLISLRQLNVSNNNIESLPRDIGHLTMLETFWCNNTGLKSIPDEIGNCVLLETFGARGNNIKQLPESFGVLTKLRWLTLESNELSELPKNFCGLENLKHLNLKSNHLTRFPKCFRSMKKLQFVFLNYNQINRLPSNDIFEECNFMRMLNMSNNPYQDKATAESNLQQHQYIMYDEDNFEKQITYEEVGEGDDEAEADYSDWENSIATSDIDSTDESSPEYELEDISVLIPEISRYVTNFC